MAKSKFDEALSTFKPLSKAQKGKSVGYPGFQNQKEADGTPKKPTHAYMKSSSGRKKSFGNLESVSPNTNVKRKTTSSGKTKVKRISAEKVARKVSQYKKKKK